MIGFIKKLFGIGGDSERDKIDEVADRVLRFADRFRNADDEDGAEIAEQYAEEIRKVRTLQEAYAVESEFMQKIKDRLPFGKKGTASHFGGVTHHHYDHDHFDTSDDWVETTSAVYGIYGNENTPSTDSSETLEGDGGDFSGAGSSTEFDSGETFSDNS